MMIFLSLLALLVLVIMLSACRAASIADDNMELAFAEWLEDHPEKKEEEIMNCHANKSIECTVRQCAYHCDEANYCSLDKILVGTHECDPAVEQCTDCMSFRKK